VDLDKYVALIFRDKSVTDGTKTALKQQIVRAAGQAYDLRQLTNGHDFHCALGASLRSDLGSRRVVHTWGREVEMHLRLSFSDDEFKASSVYWEICQWLENNHPYRILQPRLR
jgi:hypothetical protein